METISKHRQQLIEELHMFEGVFDEILCLNALQARASSDDLPQHGFELMLAIVRDRYQSFPQTMTAELRGDKKPWTETGAVCQIDSSTSPGKASEAPEVAESQGDRAIIPQSTIAHNL